MAASSIPISSRGLLAVALSLGCFLFACKGGGPGSGSSSHRDGGPGALPPPPAPPSAIECVGCAAGQVCVEGTCTDVPAMCPCPKETYCNLATSQCVVGCIGDPDCTTGRICFADVRECRVGCRADPECGAGGICEAFTCSTGCRSDAGCGAGQICEGQACQAGCRSDAGCGAGQICEGSSCLTGCRGDTGCAAGEICTGAVCRLGCRGDTDCGGGGRICDTTTSTCLGGCREDGECAAREVCDGTLCRAGCHDDTECSGDNRCDVAARSCVACDGVDGADDRATAPTLTTYTGSAFPSGGAICPAGDTDWFRAEGAGCPGGCLDRERWKVTWWIYTQEGMEPTCSYSVRWMGEIQELGGIVTRYTEEEYVGRTWVVWQCDADVFGWPYFEVEDFWVQISAAAGSTSTSGDYYVYATHDG